MSGFQYYLEEQQKQLLEEKDRLLKQLGDLLLLRESDICAQIEEVEVKLSVLRAEFQKYIS